MRSNKRFSNTTFTKRIDYEAGRHHAPRAMSEPACCRECGAVYVNRRWYSARAQLETVAPSEPLRMTSCPACLQRSRSEPRGFVFLDGAFVAMHEKEIQQLLKNEASRAAEDNPLARIMELKKSGGHKLTISTTTEHLAQRLGHALTKAYGGNVHYDFSHENKLARVSWQRD